MPSWIKLAISKPFIPFWLLLLVLTILVKDHVFFWDTIQLGSKHGHWYYENAFRNFLLPAEIDSGHIPTFGMYIAACWFVFGKSLSVSHLAMLPFLFGIIYFLYRIGKTLTEEKKTFVLLLLLIADPVFMGQAILVSPDIALLCFFLMVITAILEQKKGLKWLGLTALPLVSMRGMMLALGLFLWEVGRGEERGARSEELAERSRSQRAGSEERSDFRQNRKTAKPQNVKSQRSRTESGIRSWLSGVEARVRRAKNNTGAIKQWISETVLQKIPYYIPGGVISLAFLLYHYQQTGWIGYHPDSPWALSYERVGLKGMIKNVGILGWRLLDFGRVFLWIGFAWGAILLTQLKRLKQQKIIDLLLLVLILLIVLSLPMLSHKAILAHRYLLPVFVAFTLVFFQVWQELPGNSKWKWPVYALVVVGLTTGNLWVYPKKVAQGWDSTLAHWPHYELRAEMIDFIKRENIPVEAIGTAFPEIGPFKFKDLSNEENGFAPKELPQQSYILYANTMNDFTDEEIEELEENWEVLHEIQKGGVCFILYWKGVGIEAN